jgi:hypothetical protein
MDGVPEIVSRTGILGVHGESQHCPGPTPEETFEAPTSLGTGNPGGLIPDTEAKLWEPSGRCGCTAHAIATQLRPTHKLSSIHDALNPFRSVPASNEDLEPLR